MQRAIYNDLKLVSYRIYNGVLFKLKAKLKWKGFEQKEQGLLTVCCVLLNYVSLQM